MHSTLLSHTTNDVAHIIAELHKKMDKIGALRFTKKKCRIKNGQATKQKHKPRLLQYSCVVSPAIINELIPELILGGAVLDKTLPTVSGKGETTGCVWIISAPDSEESTEMSACWLSSSSVGLTCSKSTTGSPALDSRSSTTFSTPKKGVARLN